MISSKLKLQNNSNAGVKLKLAAVTAGNLLTLPDTITIPAFTSRVLPVKFLPSADLLGSDMPAISIAYTNVSTGKPVKAVLFIQFQQDVPITLNSPEPVVYINNLTGKAALRFRCVNRGYSNVQVLLKLNINPAGLQVIDPVRTLKLTPGSEQMVEFEATCLKLNNSLAPEFNVTAEATNMAGSLLATSIVQVTSLTSKRADMAVGQYAVGNTSGLSYTRLNQANGYYTVTANGNTVPGSSNQLSYNLNVNYYDRLNTIDAYDTWVSYSNKNFTVLAGNLMDNLDFSLFGRGIKLSVKAGANSNIDVYGMQNSYLLYTQAANHIPFSSTYALNYSFKKENGMQCNIAALFNYNPFTGVQTRFLNSRANVVKNKTHELDVRGGVSYETLKASNSAHTGIAAGADYAYRNGRFDVTLNNYYSSAYYSGLQRGVLQLNERLTYRAGSSVSVFGRYSLLNNKPLYMVDTLTINQGLYNDMTIYEAGLNLRKGSLSLTMHPYLLNQALNQTSGGAFTRINGLLNSSSKRIGVDLIYSLRGGRQLYVLSDMGFTQSSNTDLKKQRYQSLRIIATYSDKWWGLHSLIQKAPYYLSEEAIASRTDGGYYACSFGPDVHFSAFNKKLAVNVSNYFNYTSYNKNRSNSLNGRVQYQVKNGWAVSGQVFYNSYSTLSNGQNLQTRLGVVKQFTRNNVPGGKKLKVSFYDDINNNNRWDDNERAIEGVVVNIAQEGKADNQKQLTTVTGKKGTIEYVDLKKGYYSVYLLRTNGWHLATPVNINLADDKKMDVPLVKSGRLAGKVKAVKQEYITSKPLLEGIKIVATSDQNTVFTTLTNENGEFELPLPVNRYHISADVDPKRYTVSNQAQIVAVKKENNETLQFDLTDEGRKVVV
ncbi:MAG: hypothetical protein EOP51_22490, partial [Sphingobacteriales bacterium]